MRLKTIAIVIINLFLNITFANAFYVRGELGMPIYRSASGDLISANKYTWVGDLGIGFQITPRFAIEAGGGYISYDTKLLGSWRPINSKYGLINVYYRTTTFDVSRLIYFVKGGYGRASNTLAGYKQDSYIYQFGAGLEYKVNENLGVIGDMTWLGSGKFKFDNSTLYIKNIIISLGFKYGL